MSGRSVSRQDRAKACWHGEENRRTLVTAARREAMCQVALDDPAKFVRSLRLARVVSLGQIPWWSSFTVAYRWEAAEIVLLAKEAGIGTR